MTLPLQAKHPCAGRLESVQAALHTQSATSEQVCITQTQDQHTARTPSNRDTRVACPPAAHRRLRLLVGCPVQRLVLLRCAGAAEFGSGEVASLRQPGVMCAAQQSELLQAQAAGRSTTWQGRGACETSAQMSCEASKKLRNTLDVLRTQPLLLHQQAKIQECITEC